MTIYKGNQIIAGGTLPDQTGKNGKYLKTDGSNPSWGTVDALPSQSGQSGKYLTTNGSVASWATIQQAPSTDNTTINQNSSNQLQAIGMMDLGDNTARKERYVTQAQYDAMLEAGTLDANTYYNTPSDITLDLLQTIYPVGATYFTQNNSCPLSALFGTWQLQGSSTLVTSVSASDTTPVKGNGIAMGFTNGTNTFGTMAGGNGLDTYAGDYGKQIGDTYSGTRITTNKVCGLTLDSTKSGIVADTSNLLTSTTINMNIFVRIA